MDIGWWMPAGPIETNQGNRFMKHLLFAAALVAAPLALSAGPAQAQGTIRGAERGAEDGNRAAGPIGGVVGGAVGAATGTVGGVLGVEDDRDRDRRVQEEHRKPVKQHRSGH